MKRSGWRDALGGARHAGQVDDERGRSTRTRWRPPRHQLDPLASLLRARYRSRADLARASGLGQQTLRTYTDGVWRAEQPPSPYVLAMLGNAVDPDELDAAVKATLAGRGAPQLTVGQRAVLEAVRGFPDEQLVELAPLVHELIREHAAAEDTEQI